MLVRTGRNVFRTFIHPPPQMQRVIERAAFDLARRRTRQCGSPTSIYAAGDVRHLIRKGKLFALPLRPDRLIRPTALHLFPLSWFGLRFFLRLFFTTLLLAFGNPIFFAHR